MLGWPTCETSVSVVPVDRIVILSCNPGPPYVKSRQGSSFLKNMNHCLIRAHCRIRTDTEGILSPLPLPIGLSGLVHWGAPHTFTPGLGGVWSL